MNNVEINICLKLSNKNKKQFESFQLKSNVKNDKFEKSVDKVFHYIGSLKNK